MKHETLAPWAELVPGAPAPMTAEQLLALHDDAWQYELVDGRLVRMAPTGQQHQDVTDILHSAIRTHVVGHKLGKVTLPDAGFRLSQLGMPDTILSPDIAYISVERLASQPAPGTPGYERFYSVAPDLAVEIASPDQYHPEMAEKAQRYLTYGVRLVWIIWPTARQVDVWQPGSDMPVATLGESETFDGLDVLPGFTYPVADLFA